MISQMGQAMDRKVLRVSAAFDSPTEVSILLRHDFWAAAALEQRDRDGRDHGRREVAGTFAVFDGQAGGRTIGFYIEKLTRVDSPGVEILNPLSMVERRLVMGALCLEIGAWLGAAILLQHAEVEARVAASKSHALKREIGFFRCVARRVNADVRNYDVEYRAVETTLAALMKAGSKSDPLDRLRLKSESLALSVSKLAWLQARSQAAGRHAHGHDSVLGPTFGAERQRTASGRVQRLGALRDQRRLIDFGFRQPCWNTGQMTGPLEQGFAFLANVGVAVVDGGDRRPVLGRMAQDHPDDEPGDAIASRKRRRARSAHVMRRNGAADFFARRCANRFA